MKLSFTHENYQPPPVDINNAAPLYDTRYWSMPVYEGKFFNDFIRSSLKSDIRKKIIFNARTGSSWCFNKFKSLSVTFSAKSVPKIILR